jgi:hypothetical protein
VKGGWGRVGSDVRRQEWRGEKNPPPPTPPTPLQAPPVTPPDLSLSLALLPPLLSTPTLTTTSPAA